MSEDAGEPSPWWIPDWATEDPAAQEAMEQFKSLVRLATRSRFGEPLKRCGWGLTAPLCGSPALRLEWATVATRVSDATCALLILTQERHMRAITVLGRADLNHLPTALAASRSAFEIGLRIAWILRLSLQMKRTCVPSAFTMTWLNGRTRRWEDSLRPLV